MDTKLVDAQTISQPQNLESSQVLSQLNVSRDQGLTTTEVDNRQQLFGKNILPEKNPVSPVHIFFSQFKNVMIIILCAAALLSWSLGHPVDACVIVVLILVNAVIGFYQEFKAEKAISGLKKLAETDIKVKRDGELVLLKQHELVPGDIVLFEAGDKIPADCRLIAAHNFQTIESALTGESSPTEKQTGPVKQSELVSEMTNMVFMGTLVATGTAEAVVTAISSTTHLGQIAKDLEQITETKTHYDSLTSSLGLVMATVAVLSAIITFIVGYFFRHFDLYEMVTFTIATLISALPESLPIILIVVLTIGAQRMARKNALVRRLSAIETLGVVSVILTDKTGTLTLNKMEVRQLVFPHQQPLDISSLTDNLNRAQAVGTANVPSISKVVLSQLRVVLTIAGICQTVKKGHSGNLIGDPTEIALYSLAAQLKKITPDYKLTATKIDDLPFVQNLRMRASLTSETSSSESRLLVVGAPEAVIRRSNCYFDGTHSQKLLKSEQEDLEKTIRTMTGQGMRVLALAYKDVSSTTTSIDQTQLRELTYVGLLGLIDPPRPEVKRAIAIAHNAGIRVVMLTGDHPLTARAIAEEVGLLNTASTQAVLSEQQVEAMSDLQLIQSLQETTVFARLTPSTKLRIAKLFQSMKHIVAMTGDGVNDAPALKQADVGISMGEVGTDVAREASDIVLADDNFASIVNAVREGRTLFGNVRRTSAFLIITNVAESLSILLTLLLGYPLPLLPLQILWLNVITGGLTDFALATERGHEDSMKVAPRDPQEKIITPTLLPLFLSIVVAMVILVVGMFTYFLPQGIDKARTAAFMVLSVSQLLNMLNLRALHHSVFRIGVFSNKTVNSALVISYVLMLAVLYIPSLQQVFGFVTLSFGEFCSIMFASVILFLGAELIKVFFPAGTKYRRINP